jgi:hypothetical protein
MLAGRVCFAVGWDRDDFLITGAPNFPQYIGVFNHDFTFKGYLETNFLGVQGMDFDAAGNLVAIASLSTSPEVRVYSPSGSLIGGFRTDSPTQYTGDLKVSPEGNYALGTYTGGVRVFTPDGTFVRQYGDGDSRGITYVPGGKLWAGGAGTTVRVFDTDSGVQVGTFSTPEQTENYSMQYGRDTTTVLSLDYDRGGVWERDLSGTTVREYHIPVDRSDCNGMTWGPDGDVFGTTAEFYVDVVRWQHGGGVLNTWDVYPVQIVQGRVVWAGLSVPEPAALAVLAAGAFVAGTMRPSRNRAIERRSRQLRHQSRGG